MMGSVNFNSTGATDATSRLGKVGGAGEGSPFSKVTSGEGDSKVRSTMGAASRVEGSGLAVVETRPTSAEVFAGAKDGVRLDGRTESANAREIDGAPPVAMPVETTTESKEELTKDLKGLISNVRNFTKNSGKIKELIKKGADVSVQGGRGQPLLNLAIGNGNKEIVGLILNALKEDQELAKKCLGATGKSGAPPLHLAIEKGNKEIVELFLKQDPELAKTCLEAKYGYGSNTVMPLHQVIEKGNKEIVKLILDVLKENQELAKTCLEAATGEGKTPLHLAMEKGNEEIVKLILDVLKENQELAKTCLEAKNNEGKTPLHLAIEKGNEEIVELMLDILKENQGLAKTCLEAKNNEGKTPLHLAIEKGNEKIVELILNVLKQNPELAKNDSFLHLALRKGDEKIVELILSVLEQNQELAKICLEATDKYGNTPLHLAVRRENMDLAKRMIDLGGDVNIQNNNGRTLLNQAVFDGNREFAKFLLEHKAKYDLKDGKGDTALRLAVRSGDETLVGLFTANGVQNEAVEEARLLEQQRLEKMETRKTSQESSVASVLGQLKSQEGFEKCSAEQQKFILVYAEQMIRSGDKPEFALNVCKDMIFLYQQKIDKELPAKIEQGGDVTGIIKTVEALKTIMGDNSRNYGIINCYFDRQIASSEGLVSQAMQYYLLTQRQDADDMENNYYFGGHIPDPEIKAEYKGASDAERAEFGRKYTMYRFGDPKTYTRDELKAKFEKVCQKYCEGNQEKYAQTVAMYKAFVAIALDKIDFPGKNLGEKTVQAFRGVRPEPIAALDPNYNQVAESSGTIVTKHAIAESVSIGSPLAEFNGPGTDTHEFNVPFARISAPYFLHLYDNGGNNPRPESFWLQRELVCDLSGLEAKVKRNKLTIN
jgi:cytohesin